MKEFITRQLLRLLALVCAVVVWFYVVNSESIEVTKNVELEFMLPTDLAIANVVPSKVSVTVVGSRAFLRNLYYGKKLKIDLSKQKNNGKEFEVTLDKSMLPPSLGVNVVSVTPTKFQVLLERMIIKSVPVKEQFVGSLNSDFRLISSQVSPSSIMISGPLSVMRKVATMKTEPIDLSRLDGSNESTEMISFEPYDSRIVIQDQVPNLKFTYELAASKSNLIFKRVPIRFISSDRRFKANVKNVNVHLLVSPQLKKLIKRNDINVLVDVPEQEKGKVRAKVKVNMPSKAHLLKVEPDEIVLDLL